MIVTVSELKKNLKKCLETAEKETVYVTNHGKTIAEIRSPLAKRLELIDSLYGSVPDTVTLEEARKERFKHL